MVGILLTRSEENNKKFKEKFGLISNVEFFEEEVIKYTICLEEINNLKKILDKEIILITSIYAAEIASLYFSSIDIFVYVVGEESKNILAKSNFKILDFAENIDLLLPKIKDLNKVIYLRGNNISAPIQGIKKEYIIYNTEYISDFSDKIIEALETKKIKYITVFSKNSAENIISLLKMHVEKIDLNNFIFLCFSKKIADIFMTNNLVSFYPEKSNLDSFVKLSAEKI